MRLIGQQAVQKAIIFANRKREVSSLNRYLQGVGLNARDIHGDLEQAQRQATLDAFKADEVDFLVATDVAARGLDISDMPVVINFDVPFNADDYVHRIGRTGRAGKSGRAFTLGDDRRGQVGGRDRAADRQADPPARRARRRAPRGGSRESRRHPQRPARVHSAQACRCPRRSGRRARSSRRPSQPWPRCASERAHARGSAARRAPQQPARAAPARPAPVPPAAGRAASEPQPSDGPVLAFGEHTPRFLLRPVPLAARKIKPADADDLRMVMRDGQA